MEMKDICQLLMIIDVVLYSMGFIQYGFVQYGFVQYGFVQYGFVQYNVIRTIDMPYVTSTNTNVVYR